VDEERRSARSAAIAWAALMLIGAGCADPPPSGGRTIVVAEGAPDATRTPSAPTPEAGAPRPPTPDAAAAAQPDAATAEELDGSTPPDKPDADRRPGADAAAAPTGDAGLFDPDSGVPDPADCGASAQADGGCSPAPLPCQGPECGEAPGGACRTDEDCAGDTPVCIPAEDEFGPTGFINGYCISLDCDAEHPCPEGAICVEVSDDGRTACAGGCTEEADCRVSYFCDATGLCLPDPICEPVAEVCNGVDDDCNGRADEGANLCGAGAVCVNGRCNSCGDVDAAGRCVDGVAEWCLDGALMATDCGDTEFVCDVSPGLGVACLGRSGAPCDGPEDCASNVDCIPEFQFDGPSGFPGGMCVQFACQNDVDCGPGAGCFQVDDQGGTACLALCAGDAACRPGYMCVDPGVCLPPDPPLDCTPERCNGLDDDCDGDTDEGACGVTGCADEAACEFGRCLVDMPSGLCEVPCASDLDCPADARCATFSSGFSICLDACDPRTPCPAAWACLPDGICWLDCHTTGCAEGAFCAQDGQCQQVPGDVRVDITLVGVELFPVNRLSNSEPWDGPGGAILDFFLGLAQDLAQDYLNAQLCKFSGAEVPFAGDVLGNACRDLIERLLEVARELVDALIGGLFAGIEPPDPRGTVTLVSGAFGDDRNLGEVGNSYSPNWNATFAQVTPDAGMRLTVSLIDVDVFFDDAIGTVELTIDDLATAFGEGVAVPVATADQGSRNIVVVNVLVTPSP
jgi:hypothetical protein